MAAPRGNKNGVGNKGGNPGYGKSLFLKNQVDKFSPIFWKEMNRIMNAKTEDYVTKDIVKLIETMMDKSEYQAKEIIKYLARGAMEDKKFAMAEFNKIQVKMIPQTLSSDPDNPLQVGVIILPQKNANTLEANNKAGGSTR